jgi:hypothetical protein
MPTAPFPRSVILLICALAFLPARAQTQTDSARCRALLGGATRDSASVRIGLSVAAFDTVTVITKEFRGLFMQAIRQELKLPRPLPLYVYAFFTPRSAEGKIIGSTTIVPTVAGEYRAAVKPDGHLSNIRVVGGARTQAFDDAIVAALRAVGDSQSVVPLPEEIRSADDIEIKISIRLMDGMQPALLAGMEPPPPVDPLFAARVPAFGFPSGIVKGDPGNPRALYPHDARTAKLDGKVLAELAAYLTTGRNNCERCVGE